VAGRACGMGGMGVAAAGCRRGGEAGQGGQACVCCGAVWWGGGGGGEGAAQVRGMHGENGGGVRVRAAGDRKGAPWRGTAANESIGSMSGSESGVARSFLQKAVA